MGEANRTRQQKINNRKPQVVITNRIYGNYPPCLWGKFSEHLENLYSVIGPEYNVGAILTVSYDKANDVLNRSPDVLSISDNKNPITDNIMEHVISSFENACNEARIMDKRIYAVGIIGPQNYIKKWIAAYAKAAMDLRGEFASL